MADPFEARASSGGDGGLALQIVGRRTSLTELDRDRPLNRTSELVAIGRDIDHQELTRLFADFHRQT